MKSQRKVKGVAEPVLQQRNASLSSVKGNDTSETAPWVRIGFRFICVDVAQTIIKT